MHRRHPSPLELGAYFDGEPIEGVSEHVARCRKCRESLEELRGVRCAVRGELDLTDGSARRRARWTVALLPVAASIALLLAVAAPPGGLPVTRVENTGEANVTPAAPPLFMPSETAAVTPTSAPAVDSQTAGAAPRAAAASGRSGSAAPAAARNGPTPAAGAGTGTAAAPGSPAGTYTAGRSAAVAAAAPAAGPVPPTVLGPLRIGVPVPTKGPLKGEGDEVLRAVRAVVDRANETGGVAGRRVEVVAVPTNNARDRAEALGRVDALVGGFAIEAPAGMPWIMPADIVPSGPDVAVAELAAEQAGEALAADLISRGNRGTVAAVVASGPDGGLVTGLAKSMLVHSVAAGPNASCDQEIVALRKRDVVALALAVPPELARRCAASAARMGWRPAGGLLLAPSAVYANLERELVTQGARSAVALSTPNADDSGSSRFRRSAPGCDSYRSLVSFAAAELALGVAEASDGVLDLSTLRDRRWQSDLYDIDGGRHTTARVAAIRFGRWSTAEPRHSSPPGRRGVINPVAALLQPSATPEGQLPIG
jgi:hypothetical protein